jgi:hypothetical protein
MLVVVLLASPVVGEEGIATDVLVAGCTVLVELEG